MIKVNDEEIVSTFDHPYYVKGKGNNFIAENKQQAEQLIKEARPNIPKSPTYADNAPKSNYQIHPVDNEYGMSHICIHDCSKGKGNGFAGHIFWEEP